MIPLLVLIDTQVCLLVFSLFTKIIFMALFSCLLKLIASKLEATLILLEASLDKPMSSYWKENKCLMLIFLFYFRKLIFQSHFTDWYIKKQQMILFKLTNSQLNQIFKKKSGDKFKILSKL